MCTKGRRMAVYQPRGRGLEPREEATLRHQTRCLLGHSFGQPSRRWPTRSLAVPGVAASRGSGYDLGNPALDGLWPGAPPS